MTTGRTTARDTGWPDGNPTGRSTGSLVGQWWQLERQAVQLARQLQASEGFTVVGVPTRPTWLVFLGVPITQGDYEFLAVVNAANTLYQQILSSGVLAASGSVPGGGGMAPFLLGGFGESPSQAAIPSLANQIDDAGNVVPTKNLTLRDQMAERPRPNAGVPVVLRRQMRSV